MINTIFKRFVPIFMLAFALGVKAQEPAKSSCSQKLKEMQKNYEQGNLVDIPNQLSQCMSYGFSKTEKLQGYRLIILTYLFLDEYKEAEKKMNELLVYEPDYQPNNSLDPIEYISLFRSFRVEPKISFGLTLGLNQTSARLINDFAIGNTNESPTIYQAKTNFNFGASIDYLLYRKLSLTTDVLFMLRSYSSTASVLKTSELNSAESQTSINVPLTLKYTFGLKKLNFFIRGGIAVDYLMSAEAQLIRRNLETNQNDFAGPNVNVMNHRNKINFAGVLGGGVTYKLGYGFIFIDARYCYGLSNISLEAQRYKSFKSEITNYGYLDNDVALNNLQISVGYMYSLFRVKKKLSTKNEL